MLKIRQFIKSFLYKHWDEVLVIFATVLLLCIVFIPFFLSNPLTKFDHPGLLSLSWFIREHTFPDFQGWNPYFFAGFPQGILYPPLFHYAVAFLGKFLHLFVAYKLVIVIAAAFIPYTIYEFSLRIYRTKLQAFLNMMLILMTLISLPGYLGFNFDGLFDYGLGPSFVTIPLFFGYLALLFDKTLRSRFLAIIFSLMLLTNLVAAAVAILITFTFLLIHFKKRNLIRALLKFGIITMLLTLFWTIPYFVFREFSASGFPMKANKFLSLIAFGGTVSVTLFCILKISYKEYTDQSKLFLSFLIPAVLFALFTGADAFINETSTQFSIPFVHLFRLQIFSFLAVSSTLVFIAGIFFPQLIKIKKSLGFLKFNFAILFNSLAISCCFLLLIVLLLVRLNPVGSSQVAVKGPIAWDGRIMRGYKVSEVLDQSRAVIDWSVMSEGGGFAVDGLLKESSYLAPYFQSLSKSINPNNFEWSFLDQYYIENRQVPQEKAEFLVDLLWIKSLFSIDRKFPECSEYRYLTSFRTNTRDSGIVQRNMYICSFVPSRASSFVEVIDEEPRIAGQDWDMALDTWWTSKDQKLFTDHEIQEDVQYTVSAAPQIEFGKDYQEVHIKTGIPEEVLILVKMSYFSKWKAYDNEGNPVQIYRSAPSFMMVPATKEITLKYETALWEKLVYAVSGMAWIGVIIKYFIVGAKKCWKLCGKRVGG